MPKRGSEPASLPSKRACRVVTKAGQPCRSTSLDADGFCSANRRGANMAELGRRGGRARSRKQEETQGDRLERLTLIAIEELLTGEGNATAKSNATRLVLDRVAAHSTVNMELGRRAVLEEMTAQREAELPAARAKLERLIESRVEARAQERTAELERRAAEAEARLAELTS
jgi:hypothetical protein